MAGVVAAVLGPPRYLMVMAAGHATVRLTSFGTADGRLGAFRRRGQLIAYGVGDVVVRG